MKRLTLSIFTIVIFFTCTVGQNGVITGRLIDMESSEPVAGVTVTVSETNISQTTDKEGKFILKNIKPRRTEITISDKRNEPFVKYYKISFRNIYLDRNSPVNDLGHIYMVKESTPPVDFPEYRSLEFRYPYTLFEKQSQESIDEFIVIDFLKNKLNPNIVNNRYPGGAIELRKKFANNLRYPEDAVEDAVVGVSLASCSLNPDGSIDTIMIINPISESIDKEVRRLIHSTEDQWNSIDKDTIETFYTQIRFVLNGMSFYSYNLVTENMLESVMVTALGLHFGENEGLSDENIAHNITGYIQSGKYIDALNFINEAIRRNPFQPDLYQVRIMVNTKLGDREKVMEDVNKIADFMNGKSLQKILEE